MLDGVLRSCPSATLTAPGRWPAVVIRALRPGAALSALHVHRGGRASICPPFRSINDAMHILRRRLAVIDHRGVWLAASPLQTKMIAIK